MSRPFDPALHAVAPLPRAVLKRLAEAVDDGVSVALEGVPPGVKIALLEARLIAHDDDAGGQYRITTLGRQYVDGTLFPKHKTVSRSTTRTQSGYGKPSIRVHWCGDETCPGAVKCKACKAAYMRSHRPRHSEMPDDVRRRMICRAHTNTYQRRGVWPAGPCEVCGTDERVENHHYAGYDRPDLYRRLCRRHHRELHRQEEAGHV